MRSVLFPPVPIEGESAMGLVFRAASDNHHGTTGLILRRAGMPHRLSVDLAFKPYILQGLADALAVDRDEIERRSMTVRRQSGAQALDLQGALVCDWDVTTTIRRLSPKAVAQSPHHRALWFDRLIPHCTQTGTWLLETCPGCRHRLRWHNAVGMARCDGCGAPLEAAVKHTPSKTAVADAAPSTGLLDPMPAVHLPALYALPERLADIGRGQAFELGVRVASALATGPVAADRDHLKLLPARLRLELLGDVSAILLGWPESVETSLRRGFDEGGPARLDGALRRLRRLSIALKEWPRLREVLASDLEPLLVSGRRAQLYVTGGLLVPGADAARIIGVSSATFARLHRKGLIEAATRAGQTNLVGTFDLRDARRIGALFARRRPAASLSEALGISLHGIEQLCCVGAVEPLLQPSVRCAYDGLQIDSASAASLCAELDAALLPTDETSGMITLRRAMDAIGGREKPWGPVLAEIAAGRLPARKDGREGRFASRALIAQEDVARIVEARFARDDHPVFPFADAMTGRDVEELLNIHPKVTASIDRLERARIGKLYGRDRVLDLARSTISSGEIVRRWARPGQRLASHVLGDDPPEQVARTLWPRDQVEALLADEI